MKKILKKVFNRDILFEIRSQNIDIRYEIGNMRDDIRREMGNMRNDIRREMGNMRDDIRREIGNMGNDIRCEIGNMNAELISLMSSVKITNDTLLSMSTERFNEIMFSHPQYCKVISLLKWIEMYVFNKMIKNTFPKINNYYDVSYRMPEKSYPWSCTTEDGIVIMGTILENNFKNGYEIATAFGHSSLFIASAMKETRGKLTSMDCYVEEGKEDFNYTPDEMMSAINKNRENIENGILPFGLRKALENSALLELDNVNYVVGLSPQDTDKYIDGKLDFVFIDGGHFGDQPTLDFESIKDRLADKFAVFFHDNHNNCPAILHAIRTAEKYFGVKSINTYSRWNLTIVAKGIKTDFIETFIRTRI